jgi:hypothetical protein
MPFVKRDDDSILLNKLTNAARAPEDDDPSFLEITSAFWRTENTLGSYLNQESNLPDGIGDESFNPFDYFTEDERLDEKFISHAVLADNLDQINAVRRQRDREMADRETIANGGALSFIAGIAPIVADPINLIPIGGAVAKTYKAGNSILDAAVVTGTVATASTAVTEAALHTTQLERTYGESAINLTAAAFIGGILGASGKAISNSLTPAQLDEISDSMNVEPKIAAGEETVATFRDPETGGSVGAAKAFDEVGIAGEKVAKVLKATAFDPLTRTLTSDSPVTRMYANMLAENPYLMDGPATTAIESRAKIQDGKYAIALQNHNRIFKEYKKRGGTLRKRQFNEAVSKAMRNDESPVPEALQSAKSWRTELYEPIKNDLVDLGLLPEDVGVETAEAYLNRRWDAGKIQANRPQFVSTVADWLKSQDADLEVKAAEAEALRDSGVRTEVRATVKNDELADDLIAEIEDFAQVDKENGLVTVYHRTNPEDAKIILESGKFIPKEDGIFFSTSKTGQAEGYGDAVIELRIPADRLQIDDIFDNEAHLRFPAKVNKAQGIKQFIPREIELSERAVKRLEKTISRNEFIKGLDKQDNDYESIADQIAQRIIGTPDGRLPYDWKMGSGSGNTKGVSDKVGLRGPLRERSFAIPDSMVEDFLDNNIEDLGQLYLKNTAVDMELVREFGDVEMTNAFKEINEYWGQKANAVKGDSKAAQKERLRIGKQQARDIEDMSAMRDRLRRVYGNDNYDSIWYRAGTVARNWNYMRLMGGVVAASVPDVARIFMAEGFGKTFSKGLKPLVTNLQTFKVSAEEAKRYGVGIDLLLSGRSQIMADIADHTRPGNSFERAMQYGADNFGKINQMDRWTAGMKQLHAVTMQNSVIDDLLKGKIDKRLYRLGIDEANAKNMIEELKNHAKKVDGVWISNSKDWDSPELATLWGAAVRKESDRVIVVPGQERPLFMEGGMLKTVLQFKSFMVSSTQRILIAGIQGQDQNFIGGLASLITMGMMSYAFKQWDADREITDDPVALLAEGIDRAGVLGAFMEVNNTVEKLSENTYGLRPILGVDAPASRFASRSTYESMLGPTFGSGLPLIFRVANSGLDDDSTTESDIRAVRRLMLGQNLSIVRQGLDKMEETIGESL